MRFGVVVFPGSNCDHDTEYVLQDLLGQEVELLWHKREDFKACDMLVLPGGFSYGDYLRSGAIARFSPIMKKVVEFAREGGIVLGICNGFQVLCESHLLPGALLHNHNQLFKCDNVHIRAEHTSTLLTGNLNEGQVLKIPIANGEGNFYASDDVLKKIEDSKQVIFRYCGPNGELKEDFNPNGSVNNIAGICNEKGNVFGMMPHPERASDKALGNTDGLAIFESILALESQL